jgi:hypothetical protein
MMDWRFFAGGAAMMATGIIIAVIFGAYLTSGPLEEFNRNRAIAQFGGIIGGIGFLILLVSFGFSRRKRGTSGKGLPAKPDEPS